MVTVDIEINLRYILSTAKPISKLDVWDERKRGTRRILRVLT